MRVEATALSVRDDARHRRIWGRAVGFAAALALVTGCAAALLSSSAAALLAFTLWMSCLASIVALAFCAFRLLLSVGRRALPEAASLEVAGGDLIVSRQNARGMRIALADVEQGWLEEPSTLVLQTLDGLLVAAEVEEPEQREALVRAIGVAPGQSVVRVQISGIASQVPLGGLLSAVLTLASIALPTAIGVVLGLEVDERVGGAELTRAAGALAYAAIVAVSSVLAIVGARALGRMLGPRHAVVGSDGVTVLGLGRSYYRYAEMREVTPHARGLRLEMHDGQGTFLPTAARSGPAPREAAVRRQVLLDAIRRAGAGGRAHVATVKLDLLDRNGRSLAAWRDALRHVTAPGGDYRVSVLSRDDLSEVVADGAATPERRIAAAYALASADDETRRRVRIAVDACANDDLRAALEHAAEGELDETLLRRAAVRRRHDQ